MNNYFILGSGPLGCIIASYLLERNKKVVIVDNSNQNNGKENSQINIEKLLDKKIDKNIFSDYLFTIENEKKLLPASSKVVGGFTEVWGGTINVYNQNDSKEKEFDTKYLRKYYEYIIEKLNLEIEINSQDMLINKNTSQYDDIFKIMMERFETKNQTNFRIYPSTIFLNDNLIWSSKSFLQNLKSTYKDSLKHIQDFEVIDIVEDKEFITLFSKKDSMRIKNSKLFLVPGAFTSSYLASKILNKNFFTIRDSKLVVFPTLWIGKNTKSQSKNIYSQLFIDSKSNKNHTIRSQMYVLNKSLINSLNKKNRIYILILNILNFILKNRIMLIFVYSHSKNSTYFSFEIKEDKILKVKEFRFKNRDAFRMFNILLKNIKKFLLFPIPVFKKFKEYGSFHIGASSPLIENIDENGRISGDSNIHFLDSSTFMEIPSGPITFTSMAMALKIVDHITE